jgi:LysM repeat protein
MENDSISPSSSESKLPLIVGILGFALGAAGLVLGLKAKGAAQAAGDEAAAAKTSVAELGAALAAKANSADVQAIRADLDKGLSDLALNDKSITDAVTALQKVASAPKASAGAGKSATPAGPGEHAVAKGETLSSIAKKSGISLKAIQDLNPGVDATKLRIGQKLKTK